VHFLMILTNMGKIPWASRKMLKSWMLLVSFMDIGLRAD